MSYKTNVEQKTAENTKFREVLFTGAMSQLVVMSIPPGGDIGLETHEHVEQTLYIQSGIGEVELDGEKSSLEDGDVVIVTPGTAHNFRNTGSEDLKIWTVYAPPNHIDGRAHFTKAEAEADVEDEEFGHRVA